MTRPNKAVCGRRNFVAKAVHRAYAKRALMKIPSLEDYEQRAAVKVEPGA
jgi:hypothetical protein